MLRFYIINNQTLKLNYVAFEKHNLPLTKRKAEVRSNKTLQTQFTWYNQ